MILIREEIPDLEKDSITISADEYFKFAKTGVMNAIQNSKDNDDTISVINGNEALSSEITGKYGDLNVYYRLTVISDETYFYQLLFWTVREQRSKYEEDFFGAVESFKPM